MPRAARKCQLSLLSRQRQTRRSHISNSLLMTKKPQASVTTAIISHIITRRLTPTFLDASYIYFSMLSIYYYTFHETKVLKVARHYKAFHTTGITSIISISPLTIIFVRFMLSLSFDVIAGHRTIHICWPPPLLRYRVGRILPCCTPLLVTHWPY